MFGHENVVDKQADRLELAEGYGCTPVDYSKGDAVEQVTEAAGGVVPTVASTPLATRRTTPPATRARP